MHSDLQEQYAIIKATFGIEAMQWRCGLTMLVAVLESNEMSLLSFCGKENMIAGVRPSCTMPRRSNQAADLLIFEHAC